MCWDRIHGGGVYGKDLCGGNRGLQVRSMRVSWLDRCRVFAIRFGNQHCRGLEHKVTYGESGVLRVVLRADVVRRDRRFRVYTDRQDA